MSANEKRTARLNVRLYPQSFKALQKIVDLQPGMTLTGVVETRILRVARELGVRMPGTPAPETIEAAAAKRAVTDKNKEMDSRPQVGDI